MPVQLALISDDTGPRLADGHPAQVGAMARHRTCGAIIIIEALLLSEGEWFTYGPLIDRGPFMRGDYYSGPITQMEKAQ